MAKITRYSGDLKPFASNSTGLKRTVFGDTTQADDIDGNITTDFLLGWESIGDETNNFPTIQDFNAMGYTHGQLLAYLHQVGVPEWVGVQEYHSGSIVNLAGVLYLCKTNSHVSATAPNLDATNWKAAAQTNIDSIASLRLTTPGTTPVQLTGYYTAGDGGGGPLRVWKTGAIGTYVDNGGSIIVPTGGDGSGAWVWEYSGAVNVKWFGAKGDGTSPDLASIERAISATSISGQWLLWDKGTYKITSPIDIALPKMRWVSKEAIIFIDTPVDTLRGVNLTLGEGVHHQIAGDGFEVNANGKCHGALRFIQPLGTQTTSLTLEKVGARNSEMQVGAGVGSSGVDVRGGFNQVKMIDCYAENISMRVGAGTIGSNGVTGIIIQNNDPVAGAYVKNMILVRPVVRRVYSQDVAYAYDMDGIGLFANPDINNIHGPSYSDVISPDISGCWGRDIKNQVFSSRVDSPSSLRNEGPSGGIINPAYDFQTGSGLLIGGQYTTDGILCGNTGGICRFSISSSGVPVSSSWVGGTVSIINGAVVPRLHYVDSTTPTKFASTVSCVSVKGSVENFSWLRTNGFDINIIKLDGIVCESVTDAMVRVEAGSGGVAPYRGIVYAKNCINLSADKPTVRCNVPGQGSGSLLDEIGCIGLGPKLVIYNGQAETLSGISINGESSLPHILNDGKSSGSQKLYSFPLADNESLSLPTHGFNNSYLAEIVMGATRGTAVYIAVDNGGITSIYTGNSAVLGDVTDPGTGSLRVWRNTGTAELVIKNNSGGTRFIIVRFIG